MNFLCPVSIWPTLRQKCRFICKCKFVQRTSGALICCVKSPLSSTCKRRLAYYKLILPFIPCVSFLVKGKLSKTLENDIEENITHLIVLAKIALEKGDVEKAEALLYMGLKICEDYEVSFGLPFMYDILTSIAFAQGDPEKAESLLVTVIEKMINDGIAEDNDHIVDFKLRLARVYSSYHENLLAEIGFKNCLEIQKSKIHKGDVSTKTSMLYVNVLFWYGVHMIKNFRYVEAKKMLDKAYEYSSKIKGLSPYQDMVILYTLADLNMELGEYDVALYMMQTAVMLGKGISSTDLPNCYVKLAKIYMKLGVYDQARSVAKEAAKLGRIFNKFDTVGEATRLLDEIRSLKK